MANLLNIRLKISDKIYNDNKDLRIVDITGYCDSEDNFDSAFKNIIQFILLEMTSDVTMSLYPRPMPNDNFNVFNISYQHESQKLSSSYEKFISSDNDLLIGFYYLNTYYCATFEIRSRAKNRKSYQNDKFEQLATDLKEQCLNHFISFLSSTNCEVSKFLIQVMNDDHSFLHTLVTIFYQNDQTTFERVFMDVLKELYVQMFSCTLAPTNRENPPIIKPLSVLKELVTISIVKTFPINELVGILSSFFVPFFHFIFVFYLDC